MNKIIYLIIIKLIVHAVLIHMVRLELLSALVMFVSLIRWSVPFKAVIFSLFLNALQNIGGSVRLTLATLILYAIVMPVVRSAVTLLTALIRWSWLVPSVDTKLISPNPGTLSVHTCHTSGVVVNYLAYTSNPLVMHLSLFA